jgi:hypothetical protein
VLGQATPRPLRVGTTKYNYSKLPAGFRASGGRGGRAAAARATDAWSRRKAGAALTRPTLSRSARQACRSPCPCYCSALPDGPTRGPQSARRLSSSVAWRAYRLLASVFACAYFEYTPCPLIFPGGCSSTRNPRGSEKSQGLDRLGGGLYSSSLDVKREESHGKR